MKFATAMAGWPGMLLAAGVQALAALLARLRGTPFRPGPLN